MPYNRFAPRSIWAMAVAPAIIAAMNPAMTAVSPDSRRALALPWRSASVRISPAAPGARSSTVSVTTRVKVSWSSAAARPTIAISAGSSVSVN